MFREQLRTFNMRMETLIRLNGKARIARCLSFNLPVLSPFWSMLANIWLEDSITDSSVLLHSLSTSLLYALEYNDRQLTL